MKKSIQILSFLSAITILFSCGGEAYTPKPRGYFRIDFPEKDYQHFDSLMPYSFDYPTYSVVSANKKSNEPYWMNVFFPAHNAYIHLTYKHVEKDIETFLEDAYTLAYKHTIRADAIGESFYANDTTKVYGLLYDIKGNAASSLQFYVTDSVHHFLRGALYFNCRPNKDSLAPVINFLDKDIVRLMESVRWKNDKTNAQR